MGRAEMLDIVDLAGNRTGQVADKQTIHRQGLWHRDTHVWITNGTHMLQQQRAWDKDIMPGMWDISVSGHVGQGETYRHAAERETSEEVGLAVTPEQLMPVGILAVEMSFPGWQSPHRVVGRNYVVVDRNLTLDALTLQAEEVIDARLYPIDQLEADMRSAQTAIRHAPQPLDLWQLGIAGMRQASSE